MERCSGPGCSVAAPGRLGLSLEFLQSARQVVAKTLEGSNHEEMTDWGVMKEKIRADLKRHIAKETSRRPLIMPVILEI